MLKISVIVPCYNVEPYLRRGLNSLVNQTLPANEIEIICIDDKSTDNTLDILQKYETRFPQIKVIALPKNEGAAVARNTGLKCAQGEYIGFMDPDDFIDIDFFNELYLAAEKNNAHIIHGNFVVVKDGKESQWTTASPSYINRNRAWFCDVFAAAIFCRKLIIQHGIDFYEGALLGEDSVFLTKAVILANKVLAIDSISKYNYIKRDNSATGTATIGEKKIQSLLVISDVIFDFILRQKPSLETCGIIFLHRFRCLLNAMGHIHSIEKKKEAIRWLIAAYKRCPFPQIINKEWYGELLENEDEAGLLFIHLRRSYGQTSAGRKKDSDIDIRLFGRIPLLHIQHKQYTAGSMKLLRLFNAIPIWKIRYRDNEIKHYLLACILLYISSERASELFDRIRKLFNWDEGNKIIFVDIADKKQINTEPVDSMTMFEYLQRQNKTGLTPVYLLSKKNPQYAKLLRKYPKTIFPLEEAWDVSKKFLILLSQTKYIVSTFEFLDKISPYLEYKVNQSGLITIYADHGIEYFKSSSAKVSYYAYGKYKKVVTTSPINFERHVQQVGENQIIKCGLFRYDLLKATNVVSHEIPEILFFPTFSTTIIQNPPSLEYDYCQKYGRLIISLFNLQKAGRIKLNLCLHHFYRARERNPFQPFEILDDNEISKAKLRSSLLITDYSSMCFDFFYQNKPVIFFDVVDESNPEYCKEDVLNHRQLLDKENDLFNITDSVDKVIELVENYIDNKFVLEEENKERASRFFWSQNYDNCETFYNWLLNEENKK
jgi:glycosyltransferase involved in cell wall biosynthesis